MEVTGIVPLTLASLDQRFSPISNSGLCKYYCDLRFLLNLHDFRISKFHWRWQYSIATIRIYHKFWERADYRFLSGVNYITILALRYCKYRTLSAILIWEQTLMLQTPSIAQMSVPSLLRVNLMMSTIEGYRIMALCYEVHISFFNFLVDVIIISSGIQIALRTYTI